MSRKLTLVVLSLVAPFTSFAKEQSEKPVVPLEIRWKCMSFTKKTLFVHIDKLQEKQAELEKRNSSLMAVPSRLLLKDIIADYKQGDEIIMYDNGLWKKMMGRRGYALIREGKVIRSRLIAMN